ncbi:hypothetical protein ACGF5H_07085 [Micromonospora chalcea]
MLNQLEILTRAADDLAEVLDDARLTVEDPDYWGSEWFEFWRGNPLLPTCVMVDFLGNVLHVRRDATTFADERLTLTYLPSWFAAALDAVPARALARLRSGPGTETVVAQVSDRDLAVPLRIEVRVEHATATRVELFPAGVAPPPGISVRHAVPPQISYDARPSQGALTMRDGVDPQLLADGSPEGYAGVKRVHWIAPSLRISAAPGVRIVPAELFPVVDTGFDPLSLDLTSGGVAALASSPFWGWFVMDAARRQDDTTRARPPAAVTSQQALDLQIERFQNVEALPPPGAPRRRSGAPEAELSAGEWTAGPRIEEITRPDGVDLLFLTPEAALDLNRARGDPLAALAAEVAPYVAGVRGALPPNPAVPVHIRVDPQSPDDRFAYSVTYLDGGEPVDRPWLAGRTGRRFRLSVIRTPGVSVRAGLFFGPEGAAQIGEVVDFREQEVADLAAVPVAIVDHGATLRAGSLPPRAVTPTEIADLTVTAIGLLPWPPAQVVADLNDYATILRYLYDGKDLLGRDMTRLDLALTCGGVLLPEVLEVVARKAAHLVTAGDFPARRLAAAFAAVEPAGLAAATEAVAREVAP